MEGHVVMVGFSDLAMHHFDDVSQTTQSGDSPANVCNVLETDITTLQKVLLRYAQVGKRRAYCRRLNRLGSQYITILSCL
jgi:hypothetical protein